MESGGNETDKKNY